MYSRVYSDLMLRSMAEIVLRDIEKGGDKSKRFLEEMYSRGGYRSEEVVQFMNYISNTNG